MKAQTKIAKETIISFAGLSFGNTVRYLYTGLLARLVGADFLGLYSLGNSVTRMIEVLAKAGLDSGLVRYISMHLAKEDDTAVNSIVHYTIKIGLLLSLVIMTLQISLAGWLAFSVFKGTVLLKNVFIVYALSIPFNVITLLLAAVIQGHQILKYKVLVVNIISPLTLLVSMIFCYVISPESAILFPLVLASIISTFVIIRLTNHLVPMSFRNLLSAKDDSQILKFSMPLMLIAIIGTFMHWMDITMLGYFTNAKVVGLYHPAVRTAGLMKTVLLAFLSIFSPMMARMYNKGLVDEYSRLYRMVVRWITTVSLPISMLLIFFPTKFMLLFGGEYLPASDVLIILTVSTFILSVVGASGAALTMTNHPKMNLWNSIIALAVNFILNIFLIPRYGIMGAAVATFSASVILAFLRIIEVQIILKIHPFNLKYTKAIIAGIILATILLVIRPVLMPMHTILSLMIAGIVTTLIYCGVLWVLGFDDDDREVISAIKIILKPFQGN